MSIKHLQKDIRKGEGYILSDGTLNLKHLLPKVYDLIITYNMQSKTAKDIKAAIEELFINIDEEETEKQLPIFANQYYNRIKFAEDKQEEISYIWNENIFNYFNNISPNRYYFGHSEGDGACIGWFKYSDNEF